jgi:CheY-like chemotaxis protein/HPt (histidine-containing phosphotransfer) domain-containing protein
VVDANVLTRYCALKAVAIAAGTAVEDRDTAPSGRSALSLSSPSRTEARRRNQLILAAEDNETNRKVLVQQFALLGYTADFAEDGKKALQRWESGEYSLLITDLHMPYMDGYELAQTIRAKEINNGAHCIPIIALTANALKSEEHHCLSIGMDGYLTKPVRLADLKAMLEKWLPVTLTNVHQISADKFTNDDAVLEELASIVTEGRPVDISVLTSLAGEDYVKIRDFLLDFRFSANTLARNLSIACVAGEFEQVGALAHKLKSSARTVGALTLGELCDSLENASKIGNIGVINALHTQFKLEMTVVDEALSGIIANCNDDGEIP